MVKISFTINVTLDGFAYQEQEIAEEGLLNFHADYFSKTGVLILGRKTYQPLETYRPRRNTIRN